MSIEEQTFDVWHLLEGVTDAVAVKGAAKGLDVVGWIDLDVPVHVVTDPNRLRQIVMNLAGNAVKFTQHGHVVIRMQARPAAGDRATVVVTVADTGPGISDADRPRIFDRFFQANRSNTHHVAGTGLGLSITRVLVELMHGTIEFDSVVGEGSTFTVTLPVTVIERPGRTRARTGLPSPVLVVDAQTSECEMIRAHLEHHGCHVRTAATAADALADLRQEPCAAVVVSDTLPDQAGLDLVRAMTLERGRAALHVVLLGAVPNGAAAGSPVTDVVPRPVHAARVLDALDPQVSASEDGPVHGGIPALEPAEPDARPLRILVAEDNAENQRVATRLLEGAGAVVHIAPDGRAAVDMASRTRYDVILMDLQMPIMDGTQAAVAIRRDERDREEEPVPIVAFTAHAVEGFREQCLDAGMNDYIVKPIPASELVDTVRRWADRRPAVMIADDAPEIRVLVRHAFRGAYRVVPAVNGRDALAQLDRQHVAVILLDMNMPVMDGYAAAAAIRARDDGRDVPIVAMTGNEATESRARATAAGCTMHLMKPVRLATLLSTVEAAMRQPARPRETAPEQHEVVLPVHLEIDPLLADSRARLRAREAAADWRAAAAHRRSRHGSCDAAGARYKRHGCGVRHPGCDTSRTRARSGRAAERRYRCHAAGRRARRAARPRAAATRRVR
ncbi:MAG: response regulator [Vicinamibacterales bacterium]